MKIYEYNGKKNVAGERIRQARVLKRMSQEDLAARMQVRGVTLERNTVSRIEMCDRLVTDYELMIFAQVLGVSIEWLLGKDNDYSTFA